MSLSLRWTVIGIFEEQGQAQQVIDELRQAGFSDDQIGFVFREAEPAVSKADIEAEENTGAFKGGIVGGILGAAEALLTPVLGPSVANTIPTATMPVAEQAIDRFQVDAEDTQTPPSPQSDNSKHGDHREQSDHWEQEETAPGVDAEDTQTLRSPQDDNRGRRLIEEEATGAVTGGIVGGVLGAAVALLIPVIGPAFAGGILVTVFSAALGAVAGGMLGALVTLGIPEEQALHYEEEFKAGRTIVTVKTEDQQQEVLDIMYHHGARYANAHDRL
jgi:outer membrane lipoprotein SlyB